MNLRDSENEQIMSLLNVKIPAHLMNKTLASEP